MNLPVALQYPVNKNKLCRGCLSQNRDLQSIFATVSETQNIKFNEMLMDFSGIKIFPDDNLPQKLCVVCIEHTSTAYSFKRQVELSDRMLKYHLQNLQDKHDSGNFTKCADPLLTNFSVKTGNYGSDLAFENAHHDSTALFENSCTENIVCHVEKFHSDIKLLPASSKKVKYYTKTRKDASVAPSNTKIIRTLAELLSKKIYRCESCNRIFHNEDSLNGYNVCRSCELSENVKIESVWTDETTDGGRTDDSHLHICGKCNNAFEDNDEMTAHVLCCNAGECEKSPIDLSKSLPPLEKEIEDNLTDVSTFLYPRKSSRIRATKRIVKVATKCKSTNKKNVISFCDICGAEFRNEESLKLHQDMHIGRKDVECVFCSMVFEDKTRLFEHVKMHDVGKPYTCNLCSASFTKDQSLQTHTRVKHTKERAFECPLCPKKFVEQRALNRHRIAHKKQLSCHICGVAFGYRFALTSHLRLHSASSGNKTCSQCEQIFKDGFQLKRHVKVAHTGESHKCCDCDKTFSHPSRLLRHRLVHRTEAQRRLQCHYCSRRFNHSHHLSNHERTHTGTKPYLCTKCGKGFTQSVHLTVHLRQHDNILPFTCKLCGQTFARKHSLQRHYIIHRDNSIFMCGVCDLGFDDEADLQKHIKSKKHCTQSTDTKKNPGIQSVGAAPLENDNIGHNEEGQNNIEVDVTPNTKQLFVCKVCNGTFAEAISLAAHMRSHTCKYVCNICKMNFSLPSTLESHLRTHALGHRRHLCGECGARFKQKQHLKSHRLRAHTQDRPYACELCPRKFSQPGDLRVHLRRHTGDTPYSCKLCGKSFPVSNALKIHIRSHTREKPYSCTVCTRCFSTSTSLVGHMRTHSSEQRKEAASRMTEQIETLTEAVRTGKGKDKPKRISKKSNKNPTKRGKASRTNLKDGLEYNLIELLKAESDANYLTTNYGLGAGATDESGLNSINLEAKIECVKVECPSTQNFTSNDKAMCSHLVIHDLGKDFRGMVAYDNHGAAKINIIENVSILSGKEMNMGTVNSAPNKSADRLVERKREDGALLQFSNSDIQKSEIYFEDRTLLPIPSSLSNLDEAVLKEKMKHLTNQSASLQTLLKNNEQNNLVNFGGVKWQNSADIQQDRFKDANIIAESESNYDGFNISSNRIERTDLNQSNESSPVKILSDIWSSQF